MNPINDIVCNLLETPFNRWKDVDKRDLLYQGRPMNQLTIVTKKVIKNSGKSYNVNFKKSWFCEYTWLCSSLALQRLFCWPCLLFSNRNSIWNKEGFADLLNITRSLHKHGDSAEHLKSELMSRNFEKNQNTIADALKENARLFIINFNENVRLNRLFLKTVIDAVLYLCKQELAFNGHDEGINSTNRGNFKELLGLLLSKSPLEIQNHYKKIKNVFTGESKMIQNELIDSISDYINNHVKDEINDAKFFSIQVDDATDINQISQCSLIIRFVDSDGVPVERFLGFHDVSLDRTSETLYTMLDNILEHFDYQHKLIGQCYDGACVMPGHLNGLQKKIKDKAPQAVFVHCLAHRFNFILQQSYSKISKCRIFFASLSGIPSFFHHSAKRSYVLTSTCARGMLTITETRWFSNSKLVNVIVEDWDKLKEVFEFLINSEQSDNKTIQLAKGYLNDMNNFDFTFLATVFNEIFTCTDILFEILQKNSLDSNYCVSQIKNTREIVSHKRTDDVFEALFESASKITEINRSKQEYSSLTLEKIAYNYKQLYFEILDHILMEIDTRFQDCENLQFVCLADTAKFADFNLHFPSHALENLQELYGNIFNNYQRLKNELTLIFADYKFRNMSTQELLRSLYDDRDTFTEAYKLFSLILTIPSTSVSVERSFFCLKRIKTYTRNGISRERLPTLANISIHKDLLLTLMKKQPCYDDIIDNFAAQKERRIDLMYKK